MFKATSSGKETTESSALRLGKAPEPLPMVLSACREQALFVGMTSMGKGLFHSPSQWRLHWLSPGTGSCVQLPCKASVCSLSVQFLCGFCEKSLCAAFVCSLSVQLPLRGLCLQPVCSLCLQPVCSLCAWAPLCRPWTLCMAFLQHPFCPALSCSASPTVIVKGFQQVPPPHFPVLGSETSRGCVC